MPDDPTVNPPDPFEATTAFGAGNLTDALAKAESVKGQAANVMGLLNMQVPAGLQAGAPK